EVAEMLNFQRPIAGERVLLVRPDHFRDVLHADLTRRGGVVTDLVAYRTIAESAEAPAVQHLYRLLLEGAVDAVLFASPTGVQRFAEGIGPEHAARLLHHTAVSAI